MSPTWRVSPSGGGPVSRARRDGRHPQRRLHPAPVAADRPRQALHRLCDGTAAGAAVTDHALGRGARLTQVQVERGGSWVLAQTEPGDRTEERRLKQHGAARRCGVCKAADGYQSGQLTASEALTRAGWDRASQHERGLLLDMFGLSQAPENLPARPAPGRRCRHRGPARPAARSA